MIANEIHTVLSRVTCINRILTSRTVHLCSGTRLHHDQQNDRVHNFSCKAVIPTERLLLNKHIPSTVAVMSLNKYNGQNKYVPVTYRSIYKKTLHCGSGIVLSGPQMHKPHYTSVRQMQSEPVGSLSSLTDLLSQSTIVVGMQDGLLWMHSTTGLPWWLTVVSATIILRTAVTFPLAVHQLYVAVKLEYLYKKISEIMPKYQAEMMLQGEREKWSRRKINLEVMRKVKIKKTEMIIKDNCHPAKISLLMLVQLPMWITLSFALRNIATMAPKYDDNAFITLLEISEGGFGWIHNLALPDSYYILPVLFGLTNLSIIQLQKLTASGPISKVQKYVLYFFTGLIIAMVPFSATVPAILTLYWTSSSIYGLVQKLVLMSPKTRRALRIPASLRENPHPYEAVWAKVQNKFGR